MERARVALRPRALLTAGAASRIVVDMLSHLEIGFELDRRWHLMRGEMDTSKRPDLLLLARLLDEAQVNYALIGGLALQVHQAEPRTTLDIDLAVSSRQVIPSEPLRQAGFELTGNFPYTENWRGPGGTPIQFSDDPTFADAIRRAATITLEGVVLRVITPADLVRAKLRAAAEPQRRQSKRLRDLADIKELLEEHPDIASELTAEEAQTLSRLLPSERTP